MNLGPFVIRNLMDYYPCRRLVNGVNEGLNESVGGVWLQGMCVGADIKLHSTCVMICNRVSVVVDSLSIYKLLYNVKTVSTPLPQIVAKEKEWEDDGFAEVIKKTPSPCLFHVVGRGEVTLFTEQKWMLEG